jgi:hypothetical protein
MTSFVPAAVPHLSVSELICAALRGEKPSWPRADDDVTLDRICAHASNHGVSALLYERCDALGWPAAVRDALRVHAVQHALWESRHQRVIAETLAGLDRIGIRPVLFKGTALAYSLYADAALRSRADTDLIIPADALPAVHDALLALGFERGLAVEGALVSYQASYTLRSASAGTHALDLHWKISNSELLSRLFTYEELRENATPLPRLSHHALGASRVHALLLACLHRATHKQNPFYVDGVPHFESDRLIWLYDIHLLAGELAANEWEAFARIATQKGLRAVCLEGMEHARACFQTVYPQSVLAALTQPGNAEPVSRYFAGGPMRQQWMNLQALESNSHRARLMREMLLPSADYMRRKYRDAFVGWLPWLYLRRAAGGIAKRLSRSNARG